MHNCLDLHGLSLSRPMLLVNTSGSNLLYCVVIPLCLVSCAEVLTAKDLIFDAMPPISEIHQVFVNVC